MKNKHPLNPGDFINEVEKFSASGLNCKAELLLIVREAERNKNQNAFEDLIFTAKYLTGLMRINQNTLDVPGVKDNDYLKKNFSANLQKIISLIKGIISSSDKQAKTYFEEKYFNLGSEGLIKMNELIADLDKIESYLNDYKRKRMK